MGRYPGAVWANAYRIDPGYPYMDLYELSKLEEHIALHGSLPNWKVLELIGCYQATGIPQRLGEIPPIWPASVSLGDDGT